MVMVAPVTDTQPLAVSSQPMPGDARVCIHWQVDAPVGCIDVQVGMGRGSKGRGTRVGDDEATQLVLLRELARHLDAYVVSYLAAAEDDGNGDLLWEVDVLTAARSVGRG